MRFTFARKVSIASTQLTTPTFQSAGPRDGKQSLRRINPQLVHLFAPNRGFAAVLIAWTVDKQQQRNEGVFATRQQLWGRSTACACSSFLPRRVSTVK